MGADRGERETLLSIKATPGPSQTLPGLRGG